MKDQAFLLWDS